MAQLTQGAAHRGWFLRRLRFEDAKMQLAGMAGDTRESLMMYLDFEVAEDRRLCVRLTRAEVEDIVTKYTRLMAAPARGARTDTEHYQGGMWWRALTKMGEVVRRVTGGNVS